IRDRPHRSGAGGPAGEEPGRGGYEPVIPRLGAVLALLALATTGCTGGSSSGPPAVSGPAHAELVARAALDPCPPSIAVSHVSHGLPDVTLPCLGAGPAVHLAGLRGTPTVVNIWGSWCVPCQAETKYLATVYDA